jgi:GT2 family glycosyltransferase
MSQARITVGLPIYQATEQIAATIKSLQAQTYADFDAIISVDGNDQQTADACRPFLSDPRFRMVVHPERLDWAGNFNWLLRQPLNEFFCYRQHDDTTQPEFSEMLLKAADHNPGAAAVYCDCQWVGGRHDVEIAPSIEGRTLDRTLQYIERLPPQPVRGLIRREAIGQAGLVRRDEFRALSELSVWLAKLVRWGDFIRVPKTLYLRLDHGGNYHKA